MRDVLRWSLCFCAVVLLGWGMGSGPSEAMQRYVWKKRPLVVFAPTQRSVALRRQKTAIRARLAGLRQRDMVVITVVGNQVRAILGPGPAQTAAQLRQRFGVAHTAFRVILVGKDGGSKLRSSSAVTMGRVFRLIDSMPMRRREMRERGQ